MKVIDVKWYSGVQTIGLVLIEVIGGHKAYIGAGAGRSEAFDINEILTRGSKFPADHGRLMWPHITEWAP